MHPVQKGDLTVAILTATFLRRGFVVLKPLSELMRFDLVIDRGNGFERVQCKTGRLRDGAVKFNACSSTAHHRNGKRRDYRGQIEVFGVFCPDTDQCYLIPVDDTGASHGSLRVEGSKNNQSKGIRMAETYLI